METLSQKQGTLVAILQLGGYVKDLDPIVTHMRAKMDINTDLHNIAHVLWPLSKENRVTFQERKVHGGESGLFNIRLTEKGVSTARNLLGLDTPTEVGRVHHIPNSGSRATRAVGRDGTDFRQHAIVATGGPIERRVEKENPLDFVPFVVLSDEEAAVVRASKGSHKPPTRSKSQIAHETVHHAEMAESVTDETAVSPPGEVTPQVLEVTPISAASDTPTEYPVETASKHYLFNPGEFPLIAATLGKRERIERYTKAAELLGDDEAEIAISLLEKIKISPLEEEIIRLLG